MNQPPAIEPTEEAIVRDVLAGNTAAFRLIVERHQHVAFGCALAITTNAADAQDATQEAFIRLFRALPQFDVRRPLKPYLLRIVVNCSRTVVAARRRWQPLLDEPEAAAAVPDTAATPDIAALGVEQRAAVRNLINRLPQTLREVCSLFYLAEHSCQEVAEILQMNETAVKVALHRARKKLREAGAVQWRPA